MTSLLSVDIEDIPLNTEGRSASSLVCMVCLFSSTVNQETDKHSWSQNDFSAPKSHRASQLVSLKQKFT